MYQILNAIAHWRGWNYLDCDLVRTALQDNYM